MTSKDTESENWPSEINKDFAYKDNWEKEIAVFEMSRSGAHAFMYWMIKQLEEEFGVFFVNNIAWLPGKMKGSNLLYGDMSKLNSAQRDETLYDKQNFLSSAKKTLVYEVEDALNPSIPMLNDNLINIHRKKVGPSKEEFNILFLRDPFNLLASLIRKAEQLKLVYWKTDFGYLCDKNYMLFSDLWKLYAKEFLGETNLLEVCGRKKVCISYNRWFLDKEYRRSIAKEIGFVFTDEGINYVPQYSRGSSFDERKYDGSAQQMGVLKRWEKYVNDEAFKLILQDKELCELSEEIFGKIVYNDK